MKYRECWQARLKGKSRQPLTFHCILAYKCQIEVFCLFFSFNVILHVHRNSNEEKSKKSSRGMSINDNEKFLKQMFINKQGI